MSDIKIPDLPETVELQDDDLFPVETASGTRKLKKKNLITNTTVDPTPTEGSDNPVSSGGVYTALQSKMDKKEIDPAPIENSLNLVTSGGVYAAFELFDRDVILDGVLTAGQTSITFTDDHLAEDQLISIFTDDRDVNPTDMMVDKTNKTLTLIFDAYPIDHNIRIKLETSKYENYEGKPF